jgi:Family of unknown function (DUF6049)
MTADAPPSGPTRRTRGMQLTRRRHPVAAALLVVGLLWAGLAGPANPAPAAARPPAAGQAGDDPRITLLDQASPWVRPGGEFRLSVQVAGAPGDALLSMLAHEKLDSRSALSDSFNGEDPGEVVANWGSQPLAGLPRGTGDRVELNWPIGAGGAELDDEGVYPVTVMLTTPTGTLLTEMVTYLLLLPAERELYPPLSVAVLFEIGGPEPALQPDGSVSLDKARERFEQRTRALTDTGNVPATVAPLPETLDALGDDGASGQQHLDELRIGLAGREVLARPYVDLDPSALLAADLASEIPTESVAGAEVIRRRFDTEPLGGIWVTDSTIGPDDVAVLRAPMAAWGAVVPQDAVTGIPGDDPLPEGPAPLAPVALDEDGPLAMVADQALSDRLAGDGGALDAQRFLAELTTMWLTRPSVERGVVVRIPPDVDIDPELVARALQGLSLSGGDGVRPVTVSRLFGEIEPLGSAEQPTVAELAPDRSSDDFGSLAAPLRRAWDEQRGLAGTMTDTAEVTRLQRSLLVALGAATPQADRRAYVDRVDEVLVGLQDAVSAAPITITLTARSGTIPLTLLNATTQPVTVTVNLSSSQLEFPDGNRLVLTVDPGQLRHDLRVRTRTSGAFSLDVEVTSPDPEGSIVLDDATITVRSTTVSGVGLLLSGGAGLFLLIWWARHWRSTRRARRLVQHPSARGRDGDQPAGGPPPPGTPGGSASPASQPDAPSIGHRRSGPATVARHAGSHRHRLVE